MKALQKVLSRREKISQLITNLENLKTNGQVGDVQYNQMKVQYEFLREQAEENLKTIREVLKGERDQVARELEAINKEVQELQLRSKVGELRPDEAMRRLTRAQKKATALSERIAQLEATVAAESSAQVGGYVDVDVNQTVQYRARGMAGEPALQGIRRLSGTIRQLGAKGSLRSILWPDTLPTGKQVIQQVAAGVFCTVAILNLYTALQYLRIAGMHGGLAILTRISGSPSSGFLYFMGFLLFVLIAALGACAGGLLTKKEWSARLTLITCATGTIVTLLCLHAGSPLILLFVPAYFFGAYAVLDI